MTKEDRRDQLLAIMQGEFRAAVTRDDFRAHVIAKEAGVSAVWFYKLAGKEFVRLRDKLPGALPSQGSVAGLRQEIKELRRKIRELKKIDKTTMRRKLDAAILHIELLDSENRMLREKLERLEGRLKKGKVVVLTQ